MGKQYAAPMYTGQSQLFWCKETPNVQVEVHVYIMMNAPTLPDFSHAQVQAVRSGLRREITLTVQRLLWFGPQGVYAPPIFVRFGGVYNLEEAQTFCSRLNDQGLELAQLRYDERQPAKWNHLYVQVMCERIEASVTIHCRTVSIGQSDSTHSKEAHRHG